MIKKIFLKYDFSVLFVTILLSIFGLIMLYSASFYYCINTYNDSNYLVFRQGIYLIIGIILMIVISVLPYKILLNSSKIIYVFSLLFVLLTFFIGVANRGSSRWLQFGNLTFQPSELMKIGIILYLSKLCKEYIEKKDEYDDATLKNIYNKALLYGLMPSLFISITNLSTGIICMVITLSYLFLISKNRINFLIILLIIISIFAFKYPISLIIEKIGILKNYQLNRILAWADPTLYKDIAYQTNQSLYAIASGGIFGRGLGESLQKIILPEAHNDMIFAVMVEELGLVGTFFYILMYAYLIGKIFYLGFINNNINKSLVLYGISIHIFLQVTLNICVGLNLIPNTGITLPFVSYGGSSLISIFSEIGIVLCLNK